HARPREKAVCGILGFVIAEVIATYGRHLLLRDAVGTQYKARPVGRKLEIVCGDRVECDLQNGEMLVTGIQPRSTFLRRSTLRGRGVPLAAHHSPPGMVAASLPSAAPSTRDHCLCGAQAVGLASRIGATKCDLPVAATLAGSRAAHAGLRYPVIHV